MILAIHILTGLLSVVVSIVNMYSPSKLKQRVTVIATVITALLGTLLLLENSNQLGRVCVAGAVLVSLAALSVVLSNRKMIQTQKVKISND